MAHTIPAKDQIESKIIVIRVDFNVPIKEGKIKDTKRIEAACPTIQYLLENGAKEIHILTHIGRPDGKYQEDLSTKILIPELEKILQKKVEFRETKTRGTEQIQLHENVRFTEQDEKNDPAFAEEIMKNITPDIFINDGFAVSHRAHASVIGLTKHIPSFAGLLLEKEIKALSPFLKKEKQNGLTVIISGIKMETKVPVLKHFAEIADNLLLAGGIANTFLAAQGFDIGESVYDEEYVKEARRILKIANEHQTGIHLPIDAVCADNLEQKETIIIPVESVIGTLKMFDIGPHTLKSFLEIIKHSKTIIWNGPVGVLENDAFSKGTEILTKELAAQKEKISVIIGGGDTIKALKKWNIEEEKFYHVSTGGGAMLEFLEGKKLPGIESLK